MTTYFMVLNYLIFITCLSEGYNFSEIPGKNTRFRRQTSCGENEFRCDNNVCISNDFLCDGVAQCEDGSDETKKECAHLQCPAYAFQCDYGACINISHKCNGVKNCWDNSDEIECVIPPQTARPTFFNSIRSLQSLPTPKQHGACILPNHPQNGEWAIFGQSGHIPGGTVKPNTTLQFICKRNHKLYPEVQGLKLYRMCKDGNWDGEFPKCIKTCSSILTNERMTVECYFDSGKTNCVNPYEGTRATIRCNDLYRDHTLTDRPQRVCYDGNWDYTLPTCEPDCGHKSIRPAVLISGGTYAEKAEYPWQVAIYLNKDQKCGGSILSTKVILSAAHCFETTHWNEYQIGAGKLYRTFEHPNDTDAQYRDVQEVKIPEQFYIGAYLTFDIALVILKKPLQITKFVRLICLDQTNFLDSSLTNTEGVITGWGYTTEHGEPSEILKKLQVKYYTPKACQATLPLDFRTFYTPYVPDKICAGIFNTSQNACLGDSGGPLAFRKQDGRFFIRGVVSVGPFKFNAACDSSKLTLYTSVSFHRDFILQELAKYRTIPQDNSGVFKCYDGHHISNTEVCDGIPQCHDESDEIIEQCGNSECPDYKFRCKYGACIQKELMCNGVKDCADNSDENECVGSPLRNTSSRVGSGTCRLPNYPENGKWSIAWIEEGDLSAQSGQEVRGGTLIKFECENGYKVYPENNLYRECDSSNWGFLSECRKTCESRVSHSKLSITCTLNGSYVSCIDPYVGTIAKVECATFYKDPFATERPNHYCLDSGKWDYPLPICEPECGHTSIQPQPLIIGGNITETGDYPWQVAIYLDESHICAGSIVSQKVVLSVAHCFEHLDELQRYKVGAGKLYRAFNDSRDKYAQYANVEKIDTNRNYDEHYRGDIAVLILETPFKMTEYVKPICLDQDEINEDELLNNTIGVVTGWGFTSETGAPSEVLKEMNVTYFQRRQCKMHTPSHFNAYFSLDKICTGVVQKNMSTCKGDSGGPLAFRHGDLYYIRGILSLAPPNPKTGDCDSSALAFYTSVNFYRGYINEHVKKYKN